MYPQVRSPKELADFLRDWEVKFGGPLQRSRQKVSPFDSRDREQLSKGKMRGGERMAQGPAHNYGPTYAKYLFPFIGKKAVLVEIGILAGTGLALWDKVFPDGRIVGLDIDLGHYKNEYDSLLCNGAFLYKDPVVAEYDQLADVDAQRRVLDTVLPDKMADIIIDDGLHSERAIVNTAEACVPLLADKGVYIIEDNGTVLEAVKKAVPILKWVAIKTWKKWNDYLIIGQHHDK